MPVSANRSIAHGFAVAVIAAACLSAAGSAHAASVTQTVAVPAQTVLSNGPAGGGFSTTVNSAMPKFNPALGTLTGVKITMSFNYSVDSTGGPCAAARHDEITSSSVPSPGIPGGQQPVAR
jgi:hypothetical protein